MRWHIKEDSSSGGKWATFPKNSNDTLQTHLVVPDEISMNGKTFLENQNASKKIN